ncbi:MAG: metallophosphoesterase family protein [Bacteroidales bacterium]|nr:metallophosphoesterase family protein [Bacteroidales bacterium]
MKLGIISDIHEDVVRLKEAIEILEQHACDEIACLGDIVGFSIPHYGFINTRNAAECISIVRSKCSIVVAGNHDQFAIRKTPTSNPDKLFPADWYQLPFSERKKRGQDKVWLYEDDELETNLSPQDADFLNELPEFIIKEMDGLTILFSHFLYPDLTGSRIFFPESARDLVPHFRYMDEESCEISVSGHYHTNGIIWSSPKRMQFKSFGRHTIEKVPLWLVAPSVANGTHDNGLMILDTRARKVLAIPLKTRPVTIKQSFFNSILNSRL